MRLVAGAVPGVSVSMHPRTDPRASVPRCSFETLGIFAPLCLPLEFLGLSEPMESQVMAWPHIYAGEDVVLVSEAGSGKTMAYLLPLIQRVWEAEERGDKESGQVAVVVPTQDLAVQVLKQAQQLCDGGPLTCADAAGDARGSWWALRPRWSSVSVAPSVTDRASWCWCWMRRTCCCPA